MLPEPMLTPMYGSGASNAPHPNEHVGPKAVGLLAAPGKLDAPRAVFLRPDAVGPVVATDEVAAWPAQDGHAQITRGLQDGRAETVRVAEWRTLGVHAAIDAAAEMLDEGAVDLAIPATDGAIEI